MAALWLLSRELLTYLFAEHPTVYPGWWETPPRAKALVLLQECRDPSRGLPLIKEARVHVAASLAEK